MEVFPPKKSRSKCLNKWIIETPRVRDVLPGPVGYSNQRVVAEVGQGEKRVRITDRKKTLFFIVIFRKNFQENFKKIKKILEN